MRKVILQNKYSETTLVSEIMTTGLRKINLQDTIEHCMELMTANNVRYLPVFNNRIVASIISMSDVVKSTNHLQQQTQPANEYIIRKQLSIGNYFKRTTITA